MKLLNPGFENESVGGSLYWNRTSGTCHNGENNATTSCDFTNTGFTNDAKNFIEDAVWQTGSNGATSFDNILTGNFYELERSNNIGKICTSGTYCNDSVTRNTKWRGYIGLMYPSDYGYATSGGDSNNREQCLNMMLYNWNNSELSDCKNKDWLFKSGIWQWTISSNSRKDYASIVFILYGAGTLGGKTAISASDLRPVFYLKSNIKITSGNGSQTEPFHLSL